ncbi:MAG: CDP-alcohol phosphatidyltransferase family protein [bacterium]|nr:CDP-alcohol phosphatidyltransferase family protein [bacterium]
MWFIHDDKDYQVAPKIFWTDKVLRATVLKVIPDSIKPNHLTMFRFLSTPGVIILMFFENYQLGLWAFLIVAFTDALDGALARTRNQITEWGKIYDPLADKLLIGAMIYSIVLRYIDFYAALAVIALEVIIITMAWWRKHNGYLVEANVWGKIKMILQVAGTVFLLLAIVFHFEALLPFGAGAFYLAIAFAIVSLLTYGI